MPSIWTIIALFGLVAGGCAAEKASVEATAQLVEAPTDVGDGSSSEAQAEASVSTDTTQVESAEPVTVETEPPDVEPEPVVLLSGREALEANSGKAHVLWFWGAH